MDSPKIQILGEETSSQRQARIRRERREAKIKAGGSARLDKITSLSGRAAEPSPSPIVSNPTIASIPSTTNTDPSTDPDEVDISHHPYNSSRSSSQPRPNGSTTEADIRRLLRSGAPPPDGGMIDDNTYRTSFPPGQLPRSLAGEGNANGNEDPIMGLLQQMMGGGGMPGGGPGGGAEAGGGGLPPGLAALLGAGAGAGGAGPGSSGQALDRHAYLWKVVHALLALALGVYITTVTAFSGARFLREGRDFNDSNSNSNIINIGAGSGTKDENLRIRFQFFWAFATAELGLQSARFFLDRGRGVGSPSATGWLGFLVHVLPEPWKGWALLVGRYGMIYTTVVQDAMVVVFVLGFVAWWRGEVGG